jgi:threonine/homoserine efflux transporter RhtA
MGAVESGTLSGAALGGRAALGRLPAPALLIAAAFSVQSGAALATTLFDEIGPIGTVFLRTAFAAVVLGVLLRAGRRPARSGPWRWPILLGVSLAGVNCLFYESIERIPLGVAVTVEFLGPLAVAVAGSRRRLDFVWILLAGAGVALLGSPTVDVDGVGLVLALAAGVFWAAYIVVGKRLGQTWPLQRGLTVAMGISTVLVAPFGIAAHVDVRDPHEPRPGRRRPRGGDLPLPAPRPGGAPGGRARRRRVGRSQPGREGARPAGGVVSPPAERG